MGTTGARPSWPTLLAALLDGAPLTADDTAWAMGQIMDGEATGAQVGAFVAALRAKGETAQEVAGLVGVMLARAAPMPVGRAAVDTCGTGGDRAHTVNISTMAALVVAGAGVPVVKHGNRAASSSCGSADLLEALGVVADLSPAAAVECFNAVGAAFCFAPRFHPSLRHAAAPRREIGVATVFNILGPLTNPAQPTAQAVGCASAPLAPVMAGVLAARGASALVFRGDDGLDELTPCATSTVWRVADGAVVVDRLDPAHLGMDRAVPESLRGGDAQVNADVARRFLAGARGPVRDAVLLNAAAALAAYDKVAGADSGSLVDVLAGRMARAAEVVDSGAAAEALERWAAASQAAAAG